MVKELLMGAAMVVLRPVETCPLRLLRPVTGALPLRLKPRLRKLLNSVVDTLAVECTRARGVALRLLEWKSLR